jgi:rare lipoprotein A
MRSKRSMRSVRPVHVAAGALTLVIPSSAVALAAGQADARSAISIDVSRPHVGYGDHLTVSGSAPSNAGQALQLQFEPKGDSSWRTMGTTTVASDGRFRFVATMRQSGQLRALPSGSGTSTRATGVDTATQTPSVSSPQAISVSSRFRLAAKTVAVRGGRSGEVGGRLLPAVAGRAVALEGRSGGRWHTLATSRTRANGRFDVRFHPGGAPSGERLRVQFRGDRLNTGGTAPAGRVTVFQQSLASWYSDGGSTACGFHAHFGVANKSLPCGTKVTFQYGGRTVTAVVDDRGPYVGGREWDLNQNTAAALGFGGVGAVWAAW